MQEREAERRASVSEEHAEGDVVCSKYLRNWKKTIPGIQWLMGEWGEKILEKQISAPLGMACYIKDFIASARMLN